MAVREILTYQMVRPRSKDKDTGKVTEGLLERKTIPVPQLKEGEVLVKIAGCGVCHTDLGYFYEGVPTVSKPPLTLGHEISGVVIDGDKKWLNKEVIIPAVMPCNKCPICKSGRGNRCLAQKMPGNSLDIYGGFSSHIVVPSEDLCEVKNRGKTPLSHLAVVADAVTTPYQAAKRADLKEGDRVIVIGLGGVGSYMAQIAKALGAGVVVGVERKEERLNKALQYGVDFGIYSQDKDIKAIRDEFRNICKQKDLPHNWGWKIFECSGTKIGQEIALDLLSFVGKLIIIGFTMEKVEYSISRLMAFDAEMIGTWGCLPKYYPEALKLVLESKVQIEPFVETRPMSRIVETFEEAHSGRLTKRIVLEPDF
ncbi:MAG: 6-hydroxycyclohex-1-ene-1-carbonyl-CoA dehydrogenase [Planctomycetota bacterium]|nr:6-hydroxycyclohex-1-ene-1-carbonyl-CoA dehydrogenase [Planctomycetota bacterium]